MTNLLEKDEKTTIKPPVEETIKAWEEANSEGEKIVRGLDGQPVEVVLVSGGEQPVFAILVNGKNEEPFQISGDMHSIEQAFGILRFRQFLHKDLFDRWYELRGVQRLEANVSETHQGFVFGLPDKQPDSLRVGFGAA